MQMVVFNLPVRCMQDHIGLNGSSTDRAEHPQGVANAGVRAARRLLGRRALPNAHALTTSSTASIIFCMLFLFNPANEILPDFRR
mmetsp:Transcript_20253/g.60686  ORF Transcript_20253/g.60686 Transcript_20253/m.60686 type:complete len:85 (+) Transcript_20253:277-531(+)